MRHSSLLAFALLALHFTTAADAATNLLANPGFESGSLSGWSNSGSPTAAFVQTTSPHAGGYNLAHWKRSAWTVKTSQTVTGLADGTYTFKAWVINWGVQTGYIFAENCGGPTQTTPLPPASTYFQVTIGSIPVTGGSCTVGIYTSSSTGSIVADDFDFELGSSSPPPPPPIVTEMRVGGDITYRRMTTAMGGRWADAGGAEKDVLDILAPKGFNLARIRIYNQPGNFITYTDGRQYQLQPGWQNLADAVQNAKDAKARGMALFVSLHYSDFWTNPGFQSRPLAWNGLTQAQLEQAVYDYTSDVMTTLKNNGVTPEYISLGNEINNLLLGIDRTQNPAGYYNVLKRGSDAVRAVSPSTKIVVHLTTPDYGMYSDWIAGANASGLSYDVMGISLYPFWTNMSISQEAAFATFASVQSNKPVMICEVGYPWTLKAQEKGETTLIASNNLDPDGPENYGATPAGQLRYMREYFAAMFNTGRVLGVSYWDPILIDLQGGRAGDPNGWVVGGDDGVEDTTFFDYGVPHKAFTGLDAFNTWHP